MFVGTQFFVKYRLIQLSMFAQIVVCYFSFFMAVIYCLVEHYADKKIEASDARLNAEKDTLVAQIRDLKGQIAAEEIKKSVT